MEFLFSHYFQVYKNNYHNEDENLFSHFYSHKKLLGQIKKNVHNIFRHLIEKMDQENKPYYLLSLQVEKSSQFLVLNLKIKEKLPQG